MIRPLPSIDCHVHGVFITAIEKEYLNHSVFTKTAFKAGVKGGNSQSGQNREKRLLIGEQSVHPSTRAEPAESLYAGLMNFEDWHSTPLWKCRRSIKVREGEKKTSYRTVLLGTTAGHQSKRHELPAGRGKKSSVSGKDVKGTGSSCSGDARLFLDTHPMTVSNLTFIDPR